MESFVEVILLSLRMMSCHLRPGCHDTNQRHSKILKGFTRLKLDFI